MAVFVIYATIKGNAELTYPNTVGEMGMRRRSPMDSAVL